MLVLMPLFTKARVGYIGGQHVNQYGFAALDASGAKYRAHVQALGAAAEGSIWAEGVGALAVEYGGMFDYTTFRRGSLDEFDWCNATSACGPGDAATMLCS